MKRLTNIAWTITNFCLFGVLARRRARAAARAERQREFARLSGFRGFRRAYLRRKAFRQVNNHHILGNLPRRVRRELARNQGNASFRRERNLPDVPSRNYQSRAKSLANDFMRALLVRAA